MSIKFKGLITGTQNFMKSGTTNYVRLAHVSLFVNTSFSSKKDLVIPNTDDQFKIGDLVTITIEKESK